MSADLNPVGGLDPCERRRWDHAGYRNKVVATRAMKMVVMRTRQFEASASLGVRQFMDGTIGGQSLGRAKHRGEIRGRAITRKSRLEAFEGPGVTDVMRHNAQQRG